VSSSADALLRLIEQCLRDGRRIRAANAAALLADEPSESGGLPLRLAEHSAQGFDDKFEGRAIVMVQDKLNWLGVGGRALHGNILHENPQYNLGSKKNKLRTA
jgi:hypothetical protein